LQPYFKNEGNIGYVIYGGNEKIAVKDKVILPWIDFAKVFKNLANN
jgi:hypothetical protein